MYAKYLKTVEEMLPCLRKLEGEDYFDVDCIYLEGEFIPRLTVHANTQKAVKRIRQCFPKAIWKKEYDKACNWWNYNAQIKGSHVRLIACHESPKTCEPIIEKKIVERQVPTSFTTVREEQEVIVGYKCGKTVHPKTV